MQFKMSDPESYIISHLSRSQRSVVAQLRADILPLVTAVGLSSFFLSFFFPTFFVVPTSEHTQNKNL